MDDLIPTPGTAVIPSAGGIPDIDVLVADWLNLDVANGDACADTIRTYRSHFEGWLAWCRVNSVLPGQATIEAVKMYRQELVTAGAMATTISLKLTTVRRFYQAAVDRGFLHKNPAAGVRAPRERRAVKEKIKYLSAGEAELLFRAVPNDARLKSLRDSALIALMALEGLRRVEVVRACVTDIESMPDGEIRLLVHGKGKERYCYPREDTTAALRDYLILRGQIPADSEGEPIFVQVRKGGTPEGRITRIGVNKVINHYLLKAELKKPGISCHALRHTCGTLLYQATRDIRVVQETLGHEDISTSAGYAHVVERGKARHTREIPVKLGKS
jgi:integrase/recombinase XerC/integrase/recombinase XerD